MGVGVRVFFVDNEGRVKRISLKRFQSLIERMTLSDGEAEENDELKIRLQ